MGEQQACTPLRTRRLRHRFPPTFDDPDLAVGFGANRCIPDGSEQSCREHHVRAEESAEVAKHAREHPRDDTQRRLVRRRPSPKETVVRVEESAMDALLSMIVGAVIAAGVVLGFWLLLSVADDTRRRAG
jgi:hypothetical protein